MTQICHSSLNKFIEILAYKISKRYVNSYQDFEDYVQVGLLTLHKAFSNWKSELGTFEKYAKTAIVREMCRSAIITSFPVTIPRRLKKKIMNIKSMIAGGEEEPSIKAYLGISDAEWDSIRPLLISARVLNGSEETSIIRR